MTYRADLRAYADWYRAIARSERRNRLDDFADDMEKLRQAADRKGEDRSALIERAAHEAWLRASSGGSPDEIAAAVRALKTR